MMSYSAQVVGGRVMRGVRFLHLMNVNALTEDKFLGTFCEPMKDVTGEVSGASVDIWPYAEEAFAQELPGVAVDDADVDYVYLTGDGKYHHVGIWYGKPNTYLMVVVKLEDASIYGHRILDL